MAENENRTFAETVGILDELKDEYILLESIRQCAKELFQITGKPFTAEQGLLFTDKLEELKHLVMTD